MNSPEAKPLIVETIGFKAGKPVSSWVTVPEILYGFTAREISVDTQRGIVEALRIGTLPQFWID